MAYGGKEVATPCCSSGVVPSNHVLMSKTEGLFCDGTSTALSLVSQPRELQRLMKVKRSQKRDRQKGAALLYESSYGKEVQAGDNTRHISHQQTMVTHQSYFCHSRKRMGTIIPNYTEAETQFINLL